ncbi:MAG: sigma-70 family RNA polymerase sigma factor [Pyrinomonadaceae bacterium]|nr:sigma-70 family RNA polymerase sigma factor [Pyrinomonadaceae bacterium]
MTQQSCITDLLIAWNSGETQVLEKLMPVVEQELRRIAHNYMRREHGQHTLQTTALVHEAYIKLVDQHSVSWQNREHFFALSSQIMRRILMKHARDKNCAKRGGRSQHVSLEKISLLSPQKNAELVALDDALDRLAKFDKLKSRIVEMRFFGGMTVDEVADVLGLAPITIAVHWRLAKAWLKSEIRGSQYSRSKNVSGRISMSS